MTGTNLGCFVYVLQYISTSLVCLPLLRSTMEKSALLFTQTLNQVCLHRDRALLKIGCTGSCIVYTENHFSMSKINFGTLRSKLHNKIDLENCTNTSARFPAKLCKCYYHTPHFKLNGIQMVDA